MQIRSARYLALLIVSFIVIGLCFVDAGAQKRKRRSRRARPAAALPTPSPDPDAGSGTSDPRIISTADHPANGTPSGAAARRSAASKSAATPPESEQDALRRTISDLSGQLNKLTDKLNKMEEQQRSLVDIERLSRAEQRAETFRTQLRDVQAKETELQSQLDQLEFAMTPENIERTVSTYGTTRPEVAREQRQRQLEAQRTKLRAQMDQLEQSRLRLEPAIATADAEVDKLRRQMELSGQQIDPATAPAQTPAETPPPKRPDQ